MSRGAVAAAAAGVVAAVVVGWQILAGGGAPAVVSESSPVGTATAAPGSPVATAPGATAPGATAPGAWPSTTATVSASAPGAEGRQRQVLQRVIPGWAQADLVSLESRLSPARWVATWRDLPGVGPGFTRASQEEFPGALFGGAIRLDVSVKDARIVTARRLWAQGSRSMWRVEVTRVLSSNEGVESLNGTERVGWDLTLQEGEVGPQLVGFASSAAANEKPPTPASTDSSSPPLTSSTTGAGGTP